jgi:hypothetical protein
LMRKTRSAFAILRRGECNGKSGELSSRPPLALCGARHSGPE